nr:Scr1 family TA system antitoxin-like transcriptional regulator [Amycolatopsis marina]
MQSETYVRELLRWGGRVREDRFELLVRARLQRQRVLRRRLPPRFRVFVHEHALRGVVGGPRVMHEQADSRDWLARLALEYGRADPVALSRESATSRTVTTRSCDCPVGL